MSPLATSLFVLSIACGDSGSGADEIGDVDTADTAESADTADTVDTGDETCPMVDGTVVDLSAGFVADDSHFYVGMSNAIERRPIAGGDFETIVEVPDGIESPLALGDTHIFFIAGPDAWRVDKTGGVPEPLGEAPGQVTHVATDGEAIYFATFEGEGIELRRTSAGSSEILASATTEGVASIATDGAHLYWLSFQPANVRRVPVTGGPEELVADSVSDMTAIITGHELAIVGNEVLWSATYQSFDDGRLFAIAKAGGERRVLSATGTTTGFDVLGQTAYVALTGIGESQIAAVSLDGGPRSFAACVDDRVASVNALPSGLYVRVDGEMLNFPL